jgi:hypothetical protein
LSINEFTLPHGTGFDPIELVTGVSVHHVGADRGDVSRTLKRDVADAGRGRARRRKIMGGNLARLLNV